MGLSDQTPTIQGATDGTEIGNISDRLNVDTSIGGLISTGANLDAFSRLRVSNPQSIFECSFPFDKQPLIWSESTATGGTVTHATNSQSIQLATTTSNGSSAIFQSRRYLTYHPGKSMALLMSGNLIGLKANNRKRIGNFDANNGVFFELNTTLNIGVRSSISGSVVDTLVDQSNWNIDKLDGTGSSGITLDLSKQQIFLIDYQWLGSGRIRFGFVLNGQIIYCHEVLNANNLTVPWAQVAIWPLRIENTNTGVAASTTTIHLTCVNVMSEGGWGPEGTARTISNGITSRSFGAAGSVIPILSLRKQTAYVNIPFEIVDCGVFGNSNDDFYIRIMKNVTITGASWVDVSGLGQRDISATAISGGQEIYSFYVRGNGSAASQSIVEVFQQAQNAILGSDLTGTSEILSIVCTNITGSANASGFINYKELI